MVEEFAVVVPQGLAEAVYVTKRRLEVVGDRVAEDLQLPLGRLHLQPAVGEFLLESFPAGGRGLARQHEERPLPFELARGYGQFHLDAGAVLSDLAPARRPLAVGSLQLAS